VTLYLPDAIYQGSLYLCCILECTLGSPVESMTSVSSDEQVSCLVEGGIPRFSSRSRAHQRQMLVLSDIEYQLRLVNMSNHNNSFNIVCVFGQRECRLRRSVVEYVVDSPVASISQRYFLSTPRRKRRDVLDGGR